MATFDVTLPDSQPPVFPPRCVVCEAKNPDAQLQLSFLGSNTWGNTLNKVKGIPVCKGCAGGLRRRHRYQMAGYLVLFGTCGILAAVAAHLLDVSLFAMLVVFICIAAVPAILITMIFPQPFDAVFAGDAATFEFKSKIVADEFMELNSET